MFQSRKNLTMNRHAIIFSAGLTAIIVTYGSRAEAQNEAQYEEARKEIAEKKSAEAQIELTAGNVSKACQLYEVADQLDPTPLRKSDLFDCLKKLGQYATAAERWRKVANTLTGKDADYAFDQAQQLEMEAPCIIVDVSKVLQDISDLEVSIDGQTVPRASWGTRCTPVNAGEHTISAKAQNRRAPHQKASTMASRTQYRVTIATPVWEQAHSAIPNKAENPVSKAAFLIPGSIAGAIGLGCLLYAFKTQSEKESVLPTVVGYSFLSGALGTFGTGTIVYVIAEPNPADGQGMAGVSGLHVGAMKRF